MVQLTETAKFSQVGFKEGISNIQRFLDLMQGFLTEDERATATPEQLAEDQKNRMQAALPMSNTVNVGGNAVKEILKLTGKKVIADVTVDDIANLAGKDVRKVLSLISDTEKITPGLNKPGELFSSTASTATQKAEIEAYNKGVVKPSSVLDSTNIAPGESEISAIEGANLESSPLLEQGRQQANKVRKTFAKPYNNILKPQIQKGEDLFAGLEEKGKEILSPDYMSPAAKEAAAGKAPSLIELKGRPSNPEGFRYYGKSVVNVATEKLQIKTVYNFVKSTKYPLLTLAAILAPVGAIVGTYPWAGWGTKEATDTFSSTQRGYNDLFEETGNLTYLDEADRVGNILTEISKGNDTVSNIPMLNVAQASKLGITAAKKSTDLEIERTSSLRNKEMNQQRYLNNEMTTEEIAQYELNNPGARNIRKDYQQNIKNIKTKEKAAKLGLATKEIDGEVVMQGDERFPFPGQLSQAQLDYKGQRDLQEARDAENQRLKAESQANYEKEKNLSIQRVEQHAAPGKIMNSISAANASANRYQQPKKIRGVI